MKGDSSTKCWGELGSEWIEKAQANDFRVFYIMSNTFRLMGDVDGKEILDFEKTVVENYVLEYTVISGGL